VNKESDDAKFLVEAYCKTDGTKHGLRRIGLYKTKSEAMAASEAVVDEWLRARFIAGMSSSELYAQFEKLGEIPCIFRTGDHALTGTGFNPLQYAKMRCDAICAGNDTRHKPLQS